MKLTKRQKTISGFIVTAMVVTFVSGFLWVSWHMKEDAKQPWEKGVQPVVDAPAVSVMKLERADSYQRTVVHTGTVQTRSHTMVAFQRGGLVTDLMVEEGQYVTALQDVAVLDSRHLSAQKESLTARLAQANSVLAELKKGPRQESIAAAQNVVNDLQQQVNAQELRAQRSEALLKSNSIARQDYERELYAKRGLEARLSAAQNQLDELNAGTRSEQIDAQESLIKSIQAELQALQFNTDDCLLRAPFSGIIVTRYIDPGTVVTAGSPVYELIDDKNLEVHVGVPQALAGQLQSGARYNIVAGDVTLSGTLRVVLPRVDQATRTCKAILDVVIPDESSVALVTGQLAKVELVQEVADSGFWIPRLALTADHSGLWSCYVVDSAEKVSNARKQSVEVLHHRGDWVFVRGTLNDGQMLIDDGLHRIVPGQRVRPLLNGVSGGSDGDSGSLSALPARLETPDGN